MEARAGRREERVAHDAGLRAGSLHHGCIPLGKGVESCWRPGSRDSQRISSSKWTIFQNKFMHGWAAWAGTHDGGSFWRQHEPAFHAYDYGANIQIDVSPRLYHLPRETHRSRDDDDDDEEDDDGDAGGRGSEDEARRGMEGLFVDDESNGSQTADPTADNETDAASYNQIIRESDGLQKLVQELHGRFRLENIIAVSYAPAVYINSESEARPRCLLIDRNIIRGVRHSPNDLLATKGYATAALTVPTSDACATAASRDKRERLLRIIRRQGTPESPEESRPFARERLQMEVAIDNSEITYRLEQVVSLDLGRMVESYVHIFRSMPTNVFPDIICAYSRIFELALGEMERRFTQGGERGLDRAFGGRGRDGPTRRLGEAAFGSMTAVTEFVDELMRELLREGGETDGRPMMSDETKTCEAAILAWQDSPGAFTLAVLERLAAGVVAGGSRIAVTVLKTRTRHDFAGELLCVIGSDKGKDAFSSRNATWPLKLRLAIANGRKAGGGIGPSEWAIVLTGCLLAAEVEWVPDSTRGRLTLRSVVCLQGRAGIVAKPSGPLGSLRRAAEEAHIQHEGTLRQRAL
ncbi:hypothetical protein CSAL01_11177 [Colletotrichum salicis]|uniref:Uncharacterized protein n=1 Tax=Colletotrichum salicis TaxID=1209931 RepID=A0A135U808_9PEZI|nr:hypothetical protein CSAL01_11177 [Colletotrichum salicis]